ncbi:erythromycin esterase family protein [Mycobacterium uberis]|uniref:erythromycin esterase family protein n=1 Tax=Mycobacterium uberis TaxID=2162698 RepID=UPI001FB4D5FF|nr:erythromycin esterase family protein [Mycobacterium uberis]
MADRADGLLRCRRGILLAQHLPIKRYVRGLGDDKNADEALSGFERFPTWIWRNVVVCEINRMAARSQSTMPVGRLSGIRIYDLDLYSLYRSMSEMIAYLDTIDSTAAARDCQHYACFGHASFDDGQVYRFAAEFGAGEQLGGDIAGGLDP